MPLILFVIFVFIWYFPIWIGQGKTNRPSRWTIPLAILFGAIPLAIAAIVLQSFLGYGQRALALPEVANMAVDAFISAGVIEEGLKFLTAFLIIRKVDPKRKVDYVLIFGAVGLGYEITETLLGLDSIWAGLIRGVLASHVIWQLWMGMFFWELRQAKLRNDAKGVRKNAIRMFAVPVLWHGVHDFIAMITTAKVDAVDPAVLSNPDAYSSPELTVAAVLGIIFLILLLAELVFQIIILRKGLRVAKESRLLDGEIKGEEAAA